MKVACPLCGTGFVGQHWLDIHTQKPHAKCPDCPRSFVNLAAHRRRSHDLTPEGRQEIGYKIAQGMARRAERTRP
jgi:transposase-like protein